jgi:hypothetical protein
MRKPFRRSFKQRSAENNALVSKRKNCVDLKIIPCYISFSSLGMRLRKEAADASEYSLFTLSSPFALDGDVGNFDGQG